MYTPSMVTRTVIRSDGASDYDHLRPGQIDLDAQRGALLRFEKEKKNHERYGEVEISYSTDQDNNKIVTIKGNYFSKGMIDALAQFHQDICDCGCYSCKEGLHAECDSDGQSCYHIFHHRVNDGMYQGQIVKKQ